MKSFDECDREIDACVGRHEEETETKYKVNGEYISRREWLRRKGVGLTPGQSAMGTVAYTESNPLISEGLGCMKSQVGGTRDLIKKHGIQGVRVRNNGSLEITSRSGRAKFLKVRGLCDADGGYGDDPR